MELISSKDTHKNFDWCKGNRLYGMKWAFVIAGMVCAVIAIIVAIDLVDLRHQGDKLKELQQKINNTEFNFKTAEFSLAYGKELVSNRSTEVNDLIVQYCIQHADRVAAGENVTQDLITSGLLSPDYANVTCADAKLTQDAAEGFKDFMDAYKKYN